MKLSVIILNYNVRYFLELCIKSVQAAIEGLDAEIIVVDNNSPDDSCAMIKQLFPNVILIENPDNFGFSKGNNIGVTIAKGEYLCVLNPDTVVSEDTFKKTVAYADEHPRMGILGCQLIDGSGRFLPESKRNIPTPVVSIKKILGFSDAYYVNDLKSDAIENVDILVGAFMLVKKSIYKEVHGFDEDYFMYGEDIDMSYRVMKAGYQNVYYGKTKVLHFKGESTLKNKIYAQRFYGAMQIFYKKHFKSHLVFNIMVWFGSRFSNVFVRIPKRVPKKVNGYVALSGCKNFAEKLPFIAEVRDDLTNVLADHEVIFDGNTIDYTTIIELMGDADKTKAVTFRILPKGSRFMLGSDSSEQLGEIVQL